MCGTKFNGLTYQDITVRGLAGGGGGGGGKRGLYGAGGGDQVWIE